MTQLDEVERLIKLRLVDLRAKAGPGQEDEVPSIPRAKFEGLAEALGIIDHVRANAPEPVAPPPPPVSYLKTQEVADYFNVCPRTVLNWVASGRLRALRPGGMRDGTNRGGSFRYNPADVEAFADGLSEAS